jgi:hypothetical protein
MLGPNDIDDWLIDEDDRLRAEIRLLPVVQWFRRDPRGAVKCLDRALAARLRKFSSKSGLPPAELPTLLHDLRTVRSPEG